MAKGQIKCLRCDGGLNDDKYMCNECSVIMEGRQRSEGQTITYRVPAPTPRGYRASIQASEMQYSPYQREYIERITSQLNSTDYGISPTNVRQNATYQNAMYGSSVSSTRATGVRITNDGTVTEDNQVTPF